MFKTIQIALISVAMSVLTVVVSYSPPADISDKQAQMLEPVLQINKNCSATVVESTPEFGTTLVTAHHCIEGKTSGEITGYFTEVLGQKAEVKVTFNVVTVDELNDLALLHSAASGFKVAQVATEKPVEGQTVWTVGYPLGFPRMLSMGFYSQDMLIGGMNHQRASSLIAGGNSGGGLFILEDGVYKLAGVTSKGFLNSWVPQMFTPIGLYTDLAPIHALLKGWVTPITE